MTGYALVAAAAFWVAVLLCHPRRPRVGCEEQERVYMRLLGQRDVLVIIAICLTALAFFTGVIGMTAAVDDDLALLRDPCGDMGNRGAWCWSLNARNEWIRRDG